MLSREEKYFFSRHMTLMKSFFPFIQELFPTFYFLTFHRVIKYISVLPSIYCCHSLCRKDDNRIWHSICYGIIPSTCLFILNLTHCIKQLEKETLSLPLHIEIKEDKFSVASFFFPQ